MDFKGALFMVLGFLAGNGLNEKDYYFADFTIEENYTEEFVVGIKKSNEEGIIYRAISSIIDEVKLNEESQIRLSYITSLNSARPYIFEDIKYTDGNATTISAHISEYLVEQPTISCTLILTNNGVDENTNYFDSIGKNTCNVDNILSNYRKFRLFNSKEGLLVNKKNLNNLTVAMNLINNKVKDKGFIQTYMHETFNYPLLDNSKCFNNIINTIKAVTPNSGRDFSIIIMMGSLDYGNVESPAHASAVILDHIRFLKYMENGEEENFNYLYLMDAYPGVYQKEKTNQAENKVFPNYYDKILCLNIPGTVIQEEWSCTVIISEFVKLLNSKNSITDFIEYNDDDDPIRFNYKIMHELFTNIEKLENRSGPKILIKNDREKILKQFIDEIKNCSWNNP